ncbi:WD repeat-containing protein 20 [Sarcoptes scabiei]|nr:WD repeat-containing protein 20 [Sarcoptes scabiei]
MKWSIGSSLSNTSAGVSSPINSTINEFRFSPCGLYIAIVSQDGFLRVFHYQQMELIGLMRSYFGGLLCVGWSPDSKFLVTGGEDDLITVWSLEEKRVIARGQGHKSWVNSVTFDPYMTQTNLDAINFRHTNLANEERENYSNNDADDGFRTLTNYRFGSVGQDTQICLWDLTDDIIKQSTFINSNSRSIVDSYCKKTSFSKKFDGRESNQITKISSISDTSKSSLEESSTKSVKTNNFTSSSVLTDENESHHSFFNSLKKGNLKKGFSLSSRSFLDSSKNSKNHRFSNEIEPIIVNNFNVCTSKHLLGTSLCPRLKEVPMLEPHACKKISNERLTALVFRKDSIVVANHEGKIMIFSRPSKSVRF